MPSLSPLLAAPGAGDLDWEDPGLPGRRIVLRAARPRVFSPSTPVLFAHHGVNRNGADYRDYWLPLVDEADLLVIVPEFPEPDFPGGAWYNYGNRADDSGAPKPRAQWSYGVDAKVFASLGAEALTAQPRYGVWGHSAGGQYVHRAMALGFRDRVAAAVTANAGTYAMPDLLTPFPYGLGSCGLDDRALAALLRFRLTVMAGTADIDSASPHFPANPEAMRQGPTRHARAHRYIAAARAEAARLGVQCGWTIIDVEGVAHDGCRMAAAAAPVLSAALHAASLSTV